MRPPQFAGESLGLRQNHPRLAVASMRPPQFAGESGSSSASGSNSCAGFNEAPAVRGGKSAGPVQELLDLEQLQ